MIRRPWPAYASPGWLAAYAAGALAWALIAELWGAAVVIGMIAFGVLACAGAAHWMGTQDRKRDEPGGDR